MSGAATARRATAEPLATAAVTLLTVVTAIGFCRIFSDWAYLGDMLVVCVGVHAVCFALRALRVPGYVAVPATVLVLAELIAMVYYRDTIRLGLPSGDTIELFRADLRLVWQQFPTAIAPVPSEGSFAVSSAALVAVCGLVADSFAFRAFGRVEAIVPTGVVFVFTAALGTDRNRIAAAALWIAVALLTVALLRFCHARDETAWIGTRRRSLSSALPAALACATVAGLGAGVLAPRLPGAGEEALLDTRNRNSDVTQVVSPLVDIRSRLVNKSNVEYFIVAAPRPSYWRVAGLTQFDGTVWTPSDQDLVPATGQLVEPLGGAQALPQTILISNLTGNLVPVAYSPLQTSTDGLYWAASTQTLLVPDEGYSAGDRFNVISSVSDPSPAQLRVATVAGYPDPDALSLPGDFPDDVVRLAAEITAGGTTPYDKAILLQDWFRREFEYDTDVQRGHSNDAMINFLRIRRGYCEQFAGTFTAMARAVGLPARVAVGYTQGELQADGRYHVAGRHSHAWSEVWFDGYGWVLFDPTPGRGAPGAENHTGVAASQDTTAAQPGTGVGPNTVLPAAPATVSTVRPEGPQAAEDVTTTSSGPALAGTAGDGGGGSIVPWLVIGVLVLAGLWVLLMPIVLRRVSQHHAHTPADRVVAAWRSTVASVRLAGAPAVAGATPLEYAREVELATAVDHRMVAEIARQVTRTVYSTKTVDESAARRCEQLQREIEELVLERIPWTTRLMSRIDPRVARLRVQG